MSDTVSNVPTTVIDENGCYVPPFTDVLAGFSASAQAIFGADISTDNGDQDVQYTAVVAKAVSDCCNAVAAAYNSFSPETAQGVGLANVVQINGLSKGLETNSSADLLITVSVPTTITNGSVSDGTNPWLLPTPLVFSSAGSQTVTAICGNPGAISAAPNTINQIQTPTNGWTSANNAAAAAIGKAAEQDGALRQRQAISTANPAQTIAVGLEGALAALPGVTRLRLYENDTSSTNTLGITANAVAIVIEGGDAQTIANTIAVRKTLGGPTFGTTSETYTDSNGNTLGINFSRPTDEALGASIVVKNLGAFNTNVEAEIQNAVTSYYNDSSIGGTVSWSGALVAATLPGNPDGSTFSVQSLSMGSQGGTFTAADYPLAFNQVSTSVSTNITITVAS